MEAEMEPSPSPSPPSPGVQPLQLKDCMEQLLKFTLASSIDGSLGLDIGLSRDFCSNLLRHEPSNISYPDLSKGVPSYPLYKCLAQALYQCLSSGAFSGLHDKTALIDEDISIEQREDEWKKLVLEKGSELINMLKNVGFDLHVQEPFFSQLRDEQKTIEGRCALGDYMRIGPGDIILFNKCLLLQVEDVHHYDSFHDMLEAESLGKVLPGVKTVEEGVQIYRKFYSEQKERANGVLAICVTKPASQLYDSLATILSGMSYSGVQRFLGLAHSAGTIPEALTPPRSILLSSFLSPHNPNVKGSTLTDGARALAKHVHRGSSKYWGTFTGSDSDKNKLAMDVICHLMAHCCWVNLHLAPPHGVVLEIRVADGYGARWSQDGMKFIGFLEPYMEDGHSKRWKH